MKKMSTASGDFVFCSLCNEDADLPKNHEGFNGCAMCGGFGFIIRENRVSKKKLKLTRATKGVSVSYQD